MENSTHGYDEMWKFHLSRESLIYHNVLSVISIYGMSRRYLCLITPKFIRVMLEIHICVTWHWNFGSSGCVKWSSWVCIVSDTTGFRVAPFLYQMALNESVSRAPNDFSHVINDSASHDTLISVWRDTIIRFLPQANSTLIHLDLSHNDLGEHGAALLGQAIGEWGSPG